MLWNKKWCVFVTICSRGNRVYVVVSAIFLSTLAATWRLAEAGSDATFARGNKVGHFAQERCFDSSLAELLDEELAGHRPVEEVAESFADGRDVLAGHAVAPKADEVDAADPVALVDDAERRHIKTDS